MVTPFNSLEISNLPDEALMEINNLPYPHIHSGKVRELFDLGDYFLMIATDRLSAFDVILPTGIPGKGIILTQLSLFWFHLTQSLIPNQIPHNVSELIKHYLSNNEQLIPRSIIIKKTTPLNIEAIVRNYLTGSAWKYYQEKGNLFGKNLPKPLEENSQLPTPLFTPTTKARSGHDEPLTEPQARQLLGQGIYEDVEEKSLKLFELGSNHCTKAGLILVDTKFEFGHESSTGNLVLIDEVLTPDSSRFWESGKEGIPYDKQFIRNYLQSIKWNKSSPPPHLPKEIIKETQSRYLKSYNQLIKN